MGGGMECEVGLRRKTYNVLTGSVLSVWTLVESVLTNDGQKKGQHAKMQVVRMRLEDSEGGRGHRRAGGSSARSSPPPPSTSWSRCSGLALRRTRKSFTELFLGGRLAQTLKR